LKGKWVESTNEPLWYLQMGGSHTLPLTLGLTSCLQSRSYHVPKYPEMKLLFDLCIDLYNSDPHTGRVH